MLTLTLPWPPSVNKLYAVVNGRKVLSAKGRSYQQDVSASVGRQIGGKNFGEKRVAYRVVVFPPDRRRRDLSNLVKAVEDALTKSGIWCDDSQVDDMHWLRGHPTKGGSLYLEIREA